METSFKEKYGFDHDCHCLEDAEAGNLAAVSMCYLTMTDQALEACESYRGAIKEERAANAQLRIQLKELGAEPRV